MLILCLVAGAGLGAQRGSSESGAAGFLVQVNGRWEIVRGKTAQPAQARAPLHPGDVLRKVDDARDAFVLAALYTGRLHKFTTTTPLPPRIRDSLIARVVRALFPHVHEGTISAAVRGGITLHDAVARADGKSTDLSAVFGEAPVGSYSMTVHELDARGAPLAPARFTARIQVARTTRGPALPVGPYQLDVSDGPGASAGSAWIRVVPSARYGRAAAALRQLSAQADSPDADIRAAARVLARAYLLSLDDAPVKR